MSYKDRLSAKGIDIVHSMHNEFIMWGLRNGRKYLQYKGKRIPRPPIEFLEMIVKREFNIDL